MKRQILIINNLCKFLLNIPVRLYYFIKPLTESLMPFFQIIETGIPNSLSSKYFETK